MRIQLAWHNLLHRRGRSLVALSGVAFAILLIFMQLGFYASSKTSATLIYDLLRFDLLLTTRRYVFLRQSDSFHRSRLHQAVAVDGVSEVLPLRVGTAQWRNADSRNRYEVLVLGVDPTTRPFQTDDLNQQLSRLKRTDDVIVDRIAHAVLGPHAPGQTAELADRRIEVVGEYVWGSGFISNATVIASELTFQRLFPTEPASRIQVALVRLEPDADPDEVASRLAATLPADMQIWPRREIRRTEQDFYMRDRPIGLMFTSGVVIAYLVGAVILFQVLSSEITNHLSEFATLKALGYTRVQLYGIVLEEGLLFALTGFVPATVASLGLYAFVRDVAKLPVTMTAGRLALVFLLSLAMCWTAGLLAARRVEIADPADLY